MYYSLPEGLKIESNEPVYYPSSCDNYERPLQINGDILYTI